jgi:hypothetical protein
MKKIIRRILVILLIALIVIQFFRPSKNVSNVIAEKGISSKFLIPPRVHDAMKVACYDCHSNNSAYPWYWKIQPVAWFMDNHIQEGKRHLNFSIFATYPVARQYKVLDNIIHEVKEGDMPLTSYTLIHRDAVLSDSTNVAIENWATACRKQMEASYPADSLVFKRGPKPE